MNKIIDEKEALDELTIENLMEHCLDQCSRHKNSKIGYEHYILLRLLKETNRKFIEDCIIDYSYITED